MFFFFPGNFGTAVLYKKKDDNSLVVLKEINMTELNAQERSMAINEVGVQLVLKVIPLYLSNIYIPSLQMLSGNHYLTLYEPQI